MLRPQHHVLNLVLSPLYGTCYCSTMLTSPLDTFGFLSIAKSISLIIKLTTIYGSPQNTIIRKNKGCYLLNTRMVSSLMYNDKDFLWPYTSIASKYISKFYLDIDWTYDNVFILNISTSNLEKKMFVFLNVHYIVI